MPAIPITKVSFTKANLSQNFRKVPLTSNVKRDYYEILGVSRESTDQEIKSAYRKLALQYHPDRNPNNPDAEEKFKEASEAYAVLCDSEKRATYDRFGHAGLGGNGSGGAGFGGAGFQDFSDIFGDIFGISDMFGGGSRKRSRAQRGADLREDINLEFEEAVFGTETKVTVRHHESCEDCRGSGAAPGKAPVTCRSCAGQGQVRYQQGFFSVARTCPTCQGAGSVITDPCTKSGGAAGRAADQRARTFCLVAGGHFRCGARTGYSRIRLLEPGASAGLNLLVDRFWIGGDGSGELDQRAAVLAAAPRRGGDRPGASGRLQHRRTARLRPVADRSAQPGGRLRLTSFVWPHHLDRHARLKAALGIARDVTAPVDGRQRPPWVARQLSAPVAAGVLTVLWHSVSHQYWPDEEIAEVAAQVDQAARRMPIAHVTMESPQSGRFAPVELVVDLRLPGATGRGCPPAGAGRRPRGAGHHAVRLSRVPEP